MSVVNDGTFWRQNSTELVAVADNRSFGAKSAKCTPRMTRVLAREKASHGRRRFGEKFRRENSEKLAMVVDLFGEKTAKHFRRMTKVSARNKQATFVRKQQNSLCQQFANIGLLQQLVT